MRQIKRCAGFTIGDWVAIVGVLTLLVGIAIVQVAKTKAKRPHFTCASMLKNIGLAARLYATDNGKRMPGYSISSDPKKLEQVDALSFFRYMSNELVTPVVLWCPEERERKAATSFTNVSIANISYFAGLMADESRPNTFLAGDRLLELDGAPVPGGGRVFLTTNTALSWSKKIHERRGNVVRSDGSLERVTSMELQQKVRLQEVATNILLVP